MVVKVEWVAVWEEMTLEFPFLNAVSIYKWNFWSSLSLLRFTMDKMDIHGSTADKDKLYVCIADTRKPSSASSF